MDILVVALLALAVTRVANGFTFMIHQGDLKCFRDVVTVPSKITVGFIVYGGFGDIAYKIYGADNKILFEDDEITENNLVIPADKPGTYSYCFDNTISSPHEKRLTLHTEVFANADMTASTAPERDNADQETLLNLVSDLKARLRELATQQSYMEVREKTHIDTSNSTNQRVFYWSAFEVLLLVCVSIGQIYYLKQFFSEERVV